MLCGGFTKNSSHIARGMQDNFGGTQRPSRETPPFRQLFQWSYRAKAGATSEHNILACDVCISERLHRKEVAAGPGPTERGQKELLQWRLAEPAWEAAAPQLGASSAGRQDQLQERPGHPHLDVLGLQAERKNSCHHLFKSSDCYLLFLYKSLVSLNYSE